MFRRSDQIKGKDTLYNTGRLSRPIVRATGLICIHMDAWIVYIRFRPEKSSVVGPKKFSAVYFGRQVKIQRVACSC